MATGSGFLLTNPAREQFHGLIPDGRYAILRSLIVLNQWTDIEIGPYRAECPPGVTTDTPPLPEGEHPDPFVVHEELEEQPARDSPVATHTPWLDVNPWR